MEPESQYGRAKPDQQRHSRWSSPLVLAVFAAAAAAAGNAVITLIKAHEDLQLEEGKADAARILEVIRTSSPDKVAANLRFLLDAGLVIDQGRRKSIALYLHVLPMASIPSSAPSLPERLVGSWSIGRVEDCGRLFDNIVASEYEISFLRTDGTIYREKITSRSPTSFRTVSTPSEDIQIAQYLYQAQDDNTVSVTQFGTGVHFTLYRCPSDPAVKPK